MTNRRTVGSPERAVLLAAALIAGALLLHELLSVLLALVVMLVIAIPLSAGTTWLRHRGVPRAVGAPVLLVIGLGAIGGILALLLPTLVGDINGVVDQIPSIVHDLRSELRHLTGASPDDISGRAQKVIREFEDHPLRLLGPLAQIGLGVAGALGALVLVLITALYVAIRPEPLIEGTLALFPRSQRARARAVLSRIRTSWLGWLRGLSVAMVIIGVLVWAGLALIGLKFALLFAVLSALLEVVPFFGALISGAPALVYALTESPGKALATLAVFVIAHQVDGNIISPLVMARAVRLHPVVVAVGVIIVGQLLGVVGLIVAVPLISATFILVDELWVKRMDSDGAAAEEVVGPTDSGD